MSKLIESRIGRIIPPILLAVLMILGCEATTTNPYDAGIPNSNDTTVNPDDTAGTGGQTSRYGTLYFLSSPSTKWICSGPVRVTAQGVIIVDNQGDSRVTGSCQLDTTVSFGRATNLNFVWLGGASGGTTYKFFMSLNDSDWTDTPFRDDGTGWMAAPFVFLFNQNEPVKFKFVFDIPSGGKARLPLIKGYGK